MMHHLIFLTFLLQLVAANETRVLLKSEPLIERDCNLITDGKEEKICANLTMLSQLLDYEQLATNGRDKSETRIGSTHLAPLFRLDSTQLAWLNKYQPVSTRWSTLCPSSQSMSKQFHYCTNYRTCDATGVSRLAIRAPHLWSCSI